MFIQREGAIDPVWPGVGTNNVADISMKYLQQQSTISAEGSSAGKLRLWAGVRLEPGCSGCVSWSQRASGMTPPGAEGNALFLVPCVCRCRWSSHDRWSEPRPGEITNPPNLGLSKAENDTPRCVTGRGRISIIPATMKKIQCYQ